MKRRDFFKGLAGVTGAVIAAPVLLTTLKAQAEGRRGGGDTSSEMVDPKDSTAQAVKYVEATKEKGKSCATCVLYAKAGMKNGKEIGTCSIFSKKFVYANGYCNSYAKKG